MTLIEILLFAIFFMLVRIAVRVSKSGKEPKRSVDERLDKRLDDIDAALKDIRQQLDDVIYDLTPHDDDPLDLNDLEGRCIRAFQAKT